MRNIKLSDLLKSMETKINDEMGGKRIEQIESMHNDFKRIVSPILNEYDLIIKYWGIRLSDGYEDIIKYTIDFKDDKRYKFERRGTLNSISFKPVIDIQEDATLQDLLIAIDKSNTIKYIKNLEHVIAEQKQELEKNENSLSELKEKLKTFA